MLRNDLLSSFSYEVYEREVSPMSVITKQSAHADSPEVTHSTASQQLLLANQSTSFISHNRQNMQLTCSIPDFEES